MINKTKFIFVTGGVLSGLGKGVSAASLGRLLKSRGFKVFVQKFDPYYNVNPGSLSPFQHGEVFVTHDGAETDLDLGHYERFIGEKFTKESNYVQGKLLLELLEEEKQGKSGGKTIQVVPHVTNKIINKIEMAAQNSKADFIITEIGGTVGDIESLPFISAISQFSRKRRNSSFFIHATYVPYLEASNEFKSKPTQNSISQLQSMGIFPNMILLRANKQIPRNVVKKVAEKAYLDSGSCIPVPNSDNIYKVPLHFEAYGMADKVLDHFEIKPKQKTNLDDWKKYVNLIDMVKTKTVTIAMIGKYVEFEEAYKSIVEAVNISGNWNEVNIKTKWFLADDLTNQNIEERLKGIDGAIILPGFGKRGFEGKVVAAEFLREKDIPTLGICYGFQAMCVVQAKKKGIKNATSSEVSETGSFVIDIIKTEESLNGKMRLGESETILTKESVIQKLYKKTSSFERHRHKYEFNHKYIDKIQDNEFKFTGFDKETKLVEVCEMPNKKFYVGLQAHPEFNANPLNEHPVFRGLIKTIKENKA